MRICLLTTQDLDADPFPDDDWPCDPRPFLPEADWDLYVLEKGTAVEQVRECVAKGYDVYFNLCDGTPEQDRPGIEVVKELERLRVPFTGATSVSYEPTRVQMKRACRRIGVATPRYVIAKTEDDTEKAEAKLDFPLFVKHYESYASISLSRHSKAVTPGGLRRQVRKILRRHGKALVEEFVEGTEVTVLVAENPDDPERPTVYQPIQYSFPAGSTFKHSDLKWVDYEGLEGHPVDDPELDARLRDACARFFLELEGASFGRCDLRVNGDGTPYMLEINSNCGVYYPPADASGADLCLKNDPAGHEGFTRQIVEAALRRHERNGGATRTRA